MKEEFRRVNLRLPAALYETVFDAAFQNRRSFNSEVVAVLSNEEAPDVDNRFVGDRRAQLVLRMPEAMRDALKAHAGARGISMNTAVLAALEALLREGA